MASTASLADILQLSGKPWSRLAHLRAITLPLGYLRASLAHLRLRQETERVNGLEEAYDLAENFQCLGLTIQPQQVREEFGAFLDRVASRAPRTVLEIGTAEGGTLFLLAQAASPDARLLSVDLPGGPFGEGYPPWRRLLYHGFTRPSQRLVLLRAHSRDPRTVGRVRRLFEPEGIGLLFIDGDHTYAGVRADFETYAPLVRPGGLIAFHDIAPHPPDSGVEVHRYWKEVRDRYDSEEIVQDRDQGWAGIGLLRP